MYSGPKVTLEQVLTNRERRAARQRDWIESNLLPLISFTINMMGDVKRNRISTVAFEQGYQAILDICRVHDIPLISIEKYCSDTGPELLISAGITNAQEVKHTMVSIEDEHPLGRLFDIDVLDEKGNAVSRDNLNLPRRKCLICDSEAKVCARSKAHALPELMHKMSEMIRDCK